MDINVRKSNEVKIKSVMKKMEARGFRTYYCDDAKAASAQVLDLIEEGASVSWGGSATLGEIGVKDMLLAGKYNAIDVAAIADPAEVMEAKRRALLSDVYLLSSNAVTMNGELVNIDGNGNRLAALLFGPKKVIVVVGANKLTENEETAVAKIKTDACPPNSIRLGLDNPCAITGKCANCLSGKTICNHTVITRNNRIPDRIHVVFVNENLGY